MTEAEQSEKWAICGACGHWQPTATDEGECHRYAPKPVALWGVLQVRTLWPLTLKTDFCGEFLWSKTAMNTYLAEKKE